jgi:hypothetical protein
MAEERKSRNALRKELVRFKLSPEERGIVQRFVRKNGVGYLVDEHGPTVVVNYTFREPVGMGLPAGQMSAIGVAVRGPNDEFSFCQGMEIASKRAARIVAAQVCTILESYAPRGGAAFIEYMKKDLRIED